MPPNVRSDHETDAPSHWPCLLHPSCSTVSNGPWTSWAGPTGEPSKGLCTTAWEAHSGGSQPWGLCLQSGLGLTTITPEGHLDSDLQHWRSSMERMQSSGCSDRCILSRPNSTVTQHPPTRAHEVCSCASCWCTTTSTRSLQWWANSLEGSEWTFIFLLPLFS